MPRLHPVPAGDLIRVLEEMGFVFVRQRGSHQRYQHPDGRGTTVPVHAGEEIGLGLLRTILRQCEIDRDEFLRLLA